MLCAVIIKTTFQEFVSWDFNPHSNPKSSWSVWHFYATQVTVLTPQALDRFPTVFHWCSSSVDDRSRITAVRGSHHYTILVDVMKIPWAHLTPRWRYRSDPKWSSNRLTQVFSLCSVDRDRSSLTVSETWHIEISPGAISTLMTS
jgi:hypothetical protein